MKKIVHLARLTFIAITFVILAAAIVCIFDKDRINGPNALTIVLSAAAAVGVIASWQLDRK